MDNTVTSSQAIRVPWTIEDVEKCIESSPIVVFSKGTPDKPRCGFSERVLGVLENTGIPYNLVDVSEDRGVMPALTAYAGRQYLPLVYVKGTLVTSSEKLVMMIESGALVERLHAAAG